MKINIDVEVHAHKETVAQQIFGLSIAGKAKVLLIDDVARNNVINYACVFQQMPTTQKCVKGIIQHVLYLHAYWVPGGGLHDDVDTTLTSVHVLYSQKLVC